MCGAGHNPEGITAAASVRPAAKTVTCGTAPPTFTATGSITSHKAMEVTYYWALSDGRNSAPATLTFTAPGTRAVQPLAVTPHTDPASGEAVLVVTSPVVAASSPATYTLSCTPPPPLTLSASAQVSPKSELVGCSTAPSAFTFSGTITANQATTVRYYWKLPSGDGPPQTLTFTGPGTRTVSPDSFTPVTNRHGGSGQIVVTSPKGVASAPATFTLSCHPGRGQISVSLSSSPGSPDKVTCGTASPAFTVTGTITSEQPIQVTYHWVRSDGSATSPSSIALAAGVSQTVTDQVTATSDTYTGGDTLDITSPYALSQHITLDVSCSYQPLAITTESLPRGTVGAAYPGVALAASGGHGVYAWSATGLPPGLSIDAASGAISGTPTTPGSYTVTVTVSDSAQTPSAQKSYPLTIQSVLQ